MDGCIKQNNGIDIYMDYFQQEDPATHCEAPSTNTVGRTGPSDVACLNSSLCQDCIATRSR